MDVDRNKVEVVLIRDCGLSRKRSNMIAGIIAGSDIFLDKKEKKEKTKIKTEEITEVQKIIKED